MVFNHRSGNGPADRGQEASVRSSGPSGPHQTEATLQDGFLWGAVAFLGVLVFTGGVLWPKIIGYAWHLSIASAAIALVGLSLRRLKHRRIAVVLALTGTVGASATAATVGDSRWTWVSLAALTALQTAAGLIALVRGAAERKISDSQRNHAAWEQYVRSVTAYQAYSTRLQHMPAEPEREMAQGTAGARADAQARADVTALQGHEDRPGADARYARYIRSEPPSPENARSTAHFEPPSAPMGIRAVAVDATQPMARYAQQPRPASPNEQQTYRYSP